LNPEPTNVECRPPATPEEWARYFDLRWRVLREPWQQPRGSERDDGEETAAHAAIVAGADILAAGRLQVIAGQLGQVRYMAVDPRVVGQGWGARILCYLEDRARQLQLTRIELDARESAHGFYEKQGYRVIGEAPAKWGIRHRRMAKTL
jgi:N-acetylglutamate synthase-like GNAT family acetyltransferase